jgi:hypothetical protein
MSIIISPHVICLKTIAATTVIDPTKLLLLLSYYYCFLVACVTIPPPIKYSCPQESKLKSGIHPNSPKCHLLQIYWTIILEPVVSFDQLPIQDCYWKNLHSPNMIQNRKINSSHYIFT